MRIDSKFKAFAICIVFICFIASDAPQAQLILKEYIPPPTLEFANLDSKTRVGLYKVLRNVIDVERVKARREGRYEDVLFNNLYVLLKQLDPKQKDKNLQETDIVRKDALSEGQELLISFAGGIAGGGVQFLTGIPAPFLGEGAKLLGFKLGEYLVLRDISSATVEYPKIGRIEIVYVRSINRIFVNARLEEPVCQEVFILVPIELKPLRTPLGTYVCPPMWAGLTCPPEAAVKEIVPKLEDVKMVRSPINDRLCVTQGDAQPTITSSLKITPKKDKYRAGDTLTAEFTIANKGNTSISFDILTVGGRLNGEFPQDKCPDFEWNTKVPPLKPGDSYPYKGKLKLEAPGNYHFFTAYRTKEGWNTAIPTAPGVTNTKDIVVKPLTEEPIVKDWKEYKLGALSFSVPSNWHVVKTENSFVGGSTEGDVSFMVTAGTCESVKDVEQGKVRIVHFGSSGGQIEEPGTTSRIISITHMGRLLNSFKTGVSGRQVTVCILRLTENEGMISEEEGFTNWSFALIEGGRLYAFSVAGRDSAFRDAMFKQLVSKIHLLSQFTTKTDEPYKDLQRWLFGDALNVKLTAKWNEKNCKIWGPEMKPLLWDCRHTGIDFGAPEGTTVYSATDGAVIRVEHGKDCQRLECLSTVAIYNDSTHVTFIYLHMKDIKVGLGKVKAGKQIGVVGQRGPATGPHLHLEVRSGKKTRAAIDVRNTEDPYEAAKKAREAINILGTYIIKDAKDRRFLELRRDNTYLLGFFGKWSIHPELYEVLGGFPSEPHEALVPVSTRICRKLFLSSYAHDKDELYVEIRGKAFPVSESVEEGFIDTQGKVITNPSFVRETGSKLIKSARGTLWNKYLNHKGDFLEFYEDGSYMRSLEAGMWTIKGDFIKFCPKPHPGVPHYERNYCSRGKLKDNTIVLIDGLTSLRRGTIITKQ